MELAHARFREKTSSDVSLLACSRSVHGHSHESSIHRIIREQVITCALWYRYVTFIENGTKWNGTGNFFDAYCTYNSVAVPILLVHTHMYITQYGSTVYIGIAMGGPALHKDISVFTFSFSLNLSSKDIKVENR